MNLPLRLCEVMGDLRSDYGLSDMEQPLLREVFEIWCGLRGGRRIPRVETLDPLHFLRFSANLVVCDVLDDGDVEFRIAGESVTSARGASLRGIRVRTVAQERGQNLSVQQYLDAARLAEPTYYDGPSLMFGKAYLRCQRILLPFVDEDGRCRKILGVLVFGARPAHDPDKTAAKP